MGPVNVAEPEPLPDPCLVVLAGAAGSGKSTWAATHYARSEVRLDRRLRADRRHGPADLDASTDAFAVADLVIDARLRRGLAAVVDGLGLDPDRAGASATAPDGRLPAVLVILDTPDACARSGTPSTIDPYRGPLHPAPADPHTPGGRRGRGLGPGHRADRAGRDARPDCRRRSRHRSGQRSGAGDPSCPASDGQGPGRLAREVAVTADQVGFAGSR